MKTEIIKVDISKPEWGKELDYAAQVLRNGGLVAFPTETVYGLGANALDKHAVEGIYKAKGRPSDNPLIVHIAETAALKELTSGIPQTAPKLMEAFWPGPLTLLMPKSDKIPAIVTAGLDTVGIRMPSNPIALELIRRSGVPVAAPSANSSGRPSPTLAKHVVEDLSGKVDVIIDGGHSKVGVESTVLDITADPPMILRPGGVTFERLTQLLGKVLFDPVISSEGKSSAPPRAPGMKYRHYAPKAMMLLVQGSPEAVADEIGRRAELYDRDGTNVGILVTDETAAFYEPALHAYCKFISLGSRRNPESLATNLFKSLRDFDENEVGVILAEVPEAAGIGQAVMNRMLKAAGGNVIKV